MSAWKTKLFGDNALNFWGWIFASIIVVGTSLFTLVVAMKIGMHTSTDMLLLAIYLVLTGHFCLAQTNYFARIAEKLDAAKKDAPR